MIFLKIFNLKKKKIGSPLIECSHCKTINYAAINDPKNIYGPKKQ